MNREIKFRAAEKETNEIFPVLTIWQNSVALDLANSEKEWNVQVFGINDVELIQYTGLKDKNGTEIYEKDVMDCNGGYGVVFYSHNFGAWKIKMNQPFVDEQPLYHWLDDGFVVGTEYENPELLEVSL